MPGQRRQAGEGHADDLDREVAAAVASALVAGVLVAFVDDVQPARRQRGLQQGADLLDTVVWRRADGNTWR